MTGRARTLVAVGIAGAAIAGIFLASNLIEDSRIAVVTVRPYNPEFAGTRGALNVMMARGDGQGLSIMARDPLLRRSPIPPAETAYLAQRPVVSMVAWSVALGNPKRVPLGIAVSSVLGHAAAALGTAALLIRFRRNPWLAIAVGVLPGAIADVPNGGAETWGLGFAFAGLALWPDRRWSAAGLMAVAALCRETYLLVPAALGVWELGKRRIAWPLLLPPAAYAAWVTVVHARVGAWPWQSRAGKLDIPLRGFIEALPTWGAETFLNVVTVTLLLVLALHPILKDGWLRALTIAHLALAAVLGETVWGRWENFGRVLLPAFAIGLVSLVRGWFPEVVRDDRQQLGG